jgi:UDP:flavonoid glycosyltransferase YjiC (YdhE family)
MRIALVADGTRGDVQPMLVLGRALTARGHEVRICAPPDFEESAAAAGLEFQAVGIEVRVWLTKHAHAFDGKPIQMLREAVIYARQCLRAQFEILPDATSGADLIVGAGVQLAGRSVAALHGVPYHYVVYCPVLLPSADHPSMMVQRQTLPRWVNAFSWLATRVFFDRVFLRALHNERAALGLPPVANALDYLLGPTPTLAADALLAPKPRDCRVSVRQIPALQPDGEPLPAKLEAFLAQGPAPVFLGFGSMGDADPKRTTRSILDALSSIGCRAIVSRGWANLGGEALPEGVLEIEDVSHVRLFPRVAAVVHHGGAGTTTTAARAGVPQIIVPHVVDQYYWARRVQLLGLGPPAVLKPRLTAETLRSAIAETLENEVLIERARSFGERLREHACVDASFVVAA